MKAVPSSPSHDNTSTGTPRLADIINSDLLELDDLLSFSPEQGCAVDQGLSSGSLSSPHWQKNMCCSQPHRRTARNGAKDRAREVGQARHSNASISVSGVGVFNGASNSDYTRLRVDRCDMEEE